MRRNILVFCICILTVTLFLAGCGAKPSPEPLTPTKVATAQPTTFGAAADAEFAGLLKRVKKADPNVDFTAFRLVYARTSGYAPYNFKLDDLKDTLHSAQKNEDYQLAVETAGKILEQNYLLPEAHLGAIRAYEALGQKQNADFHRYVLNGLIDSILASGDGKTPETAYTVVLIEEEYLILSILDIEISSQSETEVNGHSYDILKGANKKTDGQVEIYFNIDLPFHSLADSLKP